MLRDCVLALPLYVALAEWTYQLRREAGQWKIAGSQWNIP